MKKIIEIKLRTFVKVRLASQK